MRAISAMLISIMISASQALAASGAAEGEGLGILAACFIGFGVMIVMFQFIPGILLMAGMLKGVLSLGRKDAHKTSANE